MKRTGFAPVLGLAIFLVIYATQAWGGVFPFLSTDFQTDSVTLLFYLANMAVFVAALAASTVKAYFFPLAATASSWQVASWQQSSTTRCT